MTPTLELIAEYQKLVIAYGNACARYGRSTRVIDCSTGSLFDEAKQLQDQLIRTTSTAEQRGVNRGLDIAIEHLERCEDTGCALAADELKKMKGQQ